jgi:hypothetical protein
VRLREKASNEIPSSFDMSLLKTLFAAVLLSFVATGCAISFPDYPLGAGGASSGSMSTGALMVTPCVPAACDPDALAADAAIDPMCGVFVAPGANGGDGSQGTPYGNLTTALMNDASQRPIYVCTASPGLNEAVTLSGAIDVYGGFDCASWKKSGTKTAWTAPANSAPLRITNSAFKECDGAFVDGFTITAASATGTDMARNGNSSIGAFVSGGFATLVNVDIIAGNGADGVAGAKMPPRAKGADSDPMFNGQSGLACAAGAGPTGAPANSEMCNGADVSGGNGGNGGAASGTQGGDGMGAANLPGTGYGAGGGGQTSSTCFQGEDGADGLDGSVVGGGTSLGKLDANGFQGAAGERGKDGESGGGAGGGGGLAGNGANNCAAGVAGSGGGGGGAGGCGGMGGDAGGAGGASIALASFGANVALKNVTLKAQQGGNGGDGQQGGAGGTAGQGGCVSGVCGCSGGHGGKGGSGTPGGGGKGGASFGIAFHGDMAPAIPETAIIVSLSRATGGMGGMGAIGPGGAGDPGDNVKIQAFP